MSKEIELTRDEAKLIAALFKERCGLVLDESKDYLIKNRLMPLLVEADCGTFHDLYRKLRFAGDDVLNTHFIDAITTNETHFFRDDLPFLALSSRVLPAIIDSRAGTAAAKRLRIWSAACPTGQEPYSIAMVLYDLLPDITSWQIQIMATDISDAAIAKASSGVYDEFESQRGMRADSLTKHFDRHDDKWQIRDEMRAMIQFLKINLLDNFSVIGVYDIVFCRNVAIYFEAAVQRDLFLRLAENIVPGGYLFVGSSESLGDLRSVYEPQFHCGATYYKRL